MKRLTLFEQIANGEVQRYEDREEGKHQGINGKFVIAPFVEPIPQVCSSSDYGGHLETYGRIPEIGIKRSLLVFVFSLLFLVLLRRLHLF